MMSREFPNLNLLRCLPVRVRTQTGEVACLRRSLGRQVKFVYIPLDSGHAYLTGLVYQGFADNPCL
ncbi:MAG: hypothetical protein CV087_01105 [Candidatus Brocadia sp. WS118]|nr:MAG: hypothetical protein CV087_01105 [Candidatus Brocadia sp. WS118]